MNKKTKIGKFNFCWRCGTTKGITRHHVIPKAMKPIHNIKIPLCDSCHVELNEHYGAHVKKKLPNKYRDFNNYFQSIMDENIALTNELDQFKNEAIKSV